MKIFQQFDACYFNLCLNRWLSEIPSSPICSILHNTCGNMMTVMRWMSLAWKYLFLTGKPVNYMCTCVVKKKNQPNLNNQWKNNPKKICEASRTLNLYLRIAELYVSILDSKDIINIYSQIRLEHLEGKSGTFVSFYPSPFWLEGSAGAWIISLLHLGNSKWTKPQVISSGSCRTPRGGF